MALFYTIMHPLQKRLCNFLVLLFSLACLSAYGANNPMQKIETPHFSIGFRKNNVQAAQRVANTLETIYAPVFKTLGVPPKPIRLLLNNWTVYPGGQFMPMPPQLLFQTFYVSDPYFVGNADWLSLLCIHEFRHAAQYSIQYHNTPRVLRAFYFGLGLYSFIGVPRFFNEGDAVGLETALSQSGRGRLPGWSKLYKAALLERGIAPFGKQLFGSLRHPTSEDEYRLGYYFTTYIRTRYGSKALQTIYAKTMRKFPYFGFYAAVKDATNKSVLQIYQDMSQALLRDWQKQLKGLTLTPATPLRIKKTDGLVHYVNPYVDNSGTIRVWKSGIGTRHQLVALTPVASPRPGTVSLQPLPWYTEARCFFTGYPLDTLSGAALAMGEGCAAWLEACLDPWKGSQEASQLGKSAQHIVRLQWYDVKSKKRRTLVSKCRYNALAISPSTQKLIAVACDESSTQQLVVLDTRNGNVVQKIENPHGVGYVTPSWCDEAHILVVQTHNQKNQLVRIQVATGNVEVLLPASQEHRSFPLLHEAYVLYNSSYNGIDNIYALHLPTKTCFQVTCRKYGSYLGRVDPHTKHLLFCDYTKNGMELAVMPFQPSDWIPLEKVSVRTVAHYAPLVEQEANGAILDQVPKRTYPVSKYRWWKDGLAYTGPVLSDVDINRRWGKLTLLDVWRLDSNLKISPYVYHRFGKASDIDQKKTEAGVQIRYHSCYPIFGINICRTKRNFPEYLIPIWHEKYALDVHFPYYFSLASSSGKFNFCPKITWESHHKAWTMIYKVLLQNNSTSSERDLTNPWLQKISLVIHDKKTAYPIHMGGWMVGPKLRLDFPGFGKHHYISLNPLYTQKCIHQAMFNEKTKVKMLQLAYGLPVAYPDKGIPLIWYLKKIHIEGYYLFQGKEESICGHIPYYAYFDKRLIQPYFRKKIGMRIYFQNHFFCLASSFISFQAILDLSITKDKNKSWKFDWEVSGKNVI